MLILLLSKTMGTQRSNTSSIDRTINSQQKLSFRSFQPNLSLIHKSTQVNGYNNSILEQIFDAISSEDEKKLKQLLSTPEGRKHIDTQFMSYTPLIAAVERNNLNLVKIVLEACPNLYLTDSLGFTALHHAMTKSYEVIAELMKHYHTLDIVNIQQGDIVTPPLHLGIAFNDSEVVKKVIEEYNPDLNIRDKNGNLPLHTAVESNKADLVEFLLDRGVDVNAVNNYGYTPLIVGTNHNRIEIVEILLKRGANVNLCDNAGESALYKASFNNFIDIVKLLLKYNADVNINKFNVGTPLMSAIYGENIEIVQLLLRNGANPNVITQEEETPLTIAIEKPNSIELVHLLLKYKANPNFCGNLGYTPLHKAAQLDNVDAAKILMSNNANVNATSQDGFTPLALALVHNNQRIANLLINSYANVNTITRSGASIMHYATLTDSHEIMYMLYLRGAKLNQVDDSGQTPLHWSAEGNKSNAINFLLDNNANPLIRDKKGNSPLHLMISSKNYNKDILKHLINKMKKIDIKNKEGDTPLHLACMNEDICAIELLLKKGANLFIKNKNGLRPIDYIAYSISLNTNQTVTTQLMKIIGKHSYSFNKKYTSNILPNTNTSTYVTIIKNNMSKVSNKIDAEEHEKLKKELKEFVEKTQDYEAKKRVILEAAKLGLTELVKTILDSDITLLYAKDDSTKKSLLEIAFDTKNLELVNLLIDYGYDINTFVSTTGKNILHYVAKCYTINLIVKVLLLADGRLDINKRDNNNETPLMIAKRFDNKEIAKILILNGAIDFVEEETHSTQQTEAKDNKSLNIIKSLVAKIKLVFNKFLHREV
ncbi:MAG: ankyrin repeat domain-containing protein [Candidatus Micrarchaeota archaeon]|nr:ankyrin repeat domain-containing protein [Candidatus Micrarchaeota archaeon]